MSKEVFEEVSSRPYRVEFSKAKGKCRFYIPDLQIFGIGETLDEAYANLEKEKEELIQEFIDSERVSSIPHPSEGPRGGVGKVNLATDFKGQLKLFISKIGVVFGIFLLFGIAGLFAFNKVAISTRQAMNETKFQIEKKLVRFEGMARKLVGRMKEKIPSKPGRALEKGLHRAAENPIPPEQAEKIKTSLKKIVKDLKPFVEEVRPLFGDENQPKKKVRKSLGYNP